MASTDNSQHSSVASLTDLLSSVKNIVLALNSASKVESYAYGTSNRAAISASTAVLSQPGRLVNVIVTTTGSAATKIYDATSVATISDTTNLICVIPTTDVAGTVKQINCPLLYGLVVVPGTGMVVTVTYS